MNAPRMRIDTVLGPVRVVPECLVQAVCVNGSKCWDAGVCLRGDCPGCGAPAGYPPAGPCADHATPQAVAMTGEQRS